MSNEFDNFLEDLPDLELPGRSHPKLPKPQPWSWVNGGEKIRDELLDKLDSYFMNPQIKTVWQQQIIRLLRAKAFYEEDKLAGARVKTEDDPWPFEPERSRIPDPGKDLPALCTILAFFHNERACGFNSVLTEQMIYIYPLVNLGWNTVHVRDLKRYLRYIESNFDLQGLIAKSSKTREKNRVESSSLPPSRKLALDSFVFALCKNQNLLNVKQADIYKEIMSGENLDDDRNPYKGILEKPNQESWERYLRDACNHHGKTVEAIRDMLKKEWLFAREYGQNVVHISQIEWFSRPKPD